MREKSGRQRLIRAIEYSILTGEYAYRVAKHYPAMRDPICKMSSRSPYIRGNGTVNMRGSSLWVDLDWCPAGAAYLRFDIVL